MKKAGCPLCGGLGFLGEVDAPFECPECGGEGCDASGLPEYQLPLVFAVDPSDAKGCPLCAGTGYLGETDAALECPHQCQLPLIFPNEGPESMTARGLSVWRKAINLWLHHFGARRRVSA